MFSVPAFPYSLGELIIAQPLLNIGTVGHVDHGKTSLVNALTGRWTDTHSEELKRGITIKLGYADAIIRTCPKCVAPYNRTTLEKCPRCNSTTKEGRKVSFIDAPGHETLMATVIAASSIMDGALFVIAANEKCPQAQTIEHLMVLEASGIKNVVIAQNKVDLVSKQRALEHYKELREFLRGSSFENSPIVPTAALSPETLGPLLTTIDETIPTPKRDEGAEPELFIARSFDVNKPGTNIPKILGGVVGGSIVRGKFKVGDEVEMAPGILKKKKEREFYQPLSTRIASLLTGSEHLDEALPGGLVGVATYLDPSITKANSLVGSLFMRKGKLPPVRSELVVEVTPLKRQVETFASVPGLNEPLVLGVGTNTTVGFIIERKKKSIKLKLKKPVCTRNDAVIAVMRRSKTRWHLYGTARILE